MLAWNISVAIIINFVLQLVISISESRVIKSKTYTFVITHVTGGIMQIDCTGNRIMSFVICGACLGSAD